MGDNEENENDDDMDKEKEKEQLKDEIGATSNENTENKPIETQISKELNEDQKTASFEVLMAADKANDEKPIEFPPKLNDENNAKKEEIKKEPMKRQESGFSKVMRERKVRYIAAYKKRIKRVYTLKDPSKLSKVDGFVKKFSVDAEKIHGLYTKICKKHSLAPCELYDGNEHAKPIPPDEKEQVANKQTTPEQSLSKSLTSEPDKQPTFKFVVEDKPSDEPIKSEPNKPSQSPFSWGVPSKNTDE